MKGKLKYILAAIFTIILFIPMISEMIQNARPNEINYDTFKENFSNNKEVIVYIDSEKGLTRDAIVANLINYKIENDKEYQVIKYESLSEDEKKEITKLNEQILKFPAFIFIKNNEIVAVRNGAYSHNELKVLGDKYFSAGSGEIRYKVAGNTDEFIARADKDQVLMLVLGRTSCPYCEKFREVYNSLASQYDVDIYYFDSDYYDKDEYAKLMAKNYIVPAFSSSYKNPDGEFVACTGTKKESTINKGFSTPTTLFIKNGKTVDCLLGVISEENLIKTFNYNNIPKIN